MNASPGISAKEMAACCGVSYRVLDYWDRMGVLTPSVQRARGSGSHQHHRRYSADDARVGRALGVLSRLGAQVPTLTRAAEQLRKIPTWTGHVYVDADGNLRAMLSDGAAWCLDLAWCERHPCCSARPLALVG